MEGHPIGTITTSKPFAPMFAGQFVSIRSLPKDIRETLTAMFPPANTGEQLLEILRVVHRLSSSPTKPGSAAHIVRLVCREALVPEAPKAPERQQPERKLSPPCVQIPEAASFPI